ncbi:MAG: glycosyltransferase family 4 protein, partial [Clostridiaceae bacterium]|nr:glycosyltransferase family 4 protein [Clostridiaceae bacterium]
MKKILLVANTDWYLYNFRMSLARFLKASGFEVIFVAPSGEYQQKIINEGVGFIPWQVKRRS